ncbi:hypothetical protein [Streptomyces sp. NPDC023838]|uniref:hypothetical protein n=1 Tax=Streptomyces sp. NPDC023838 TaxID=3154325 RepID=UPI0033EB9F6B
MVILQVSPPDRVGPVVLGMTIDEAESALHSIEGFQGANESLVPVRGQANYVSGLSIHTHLDSHRLVNAIEVFKPHHGVSVTLEGIDLFGASAEIVVERLGRFTEIAEEEEGCSIIAPSLLVALWRPFVAESEHDEEGYYFQSVLLARPGYYD